MVYNKIDRRHYRQHGGGLVTDLIKIFGKKALETVASKGAERLGQLAINKIAPVQKIKQDILNLKGNGKTGFYMTNYLKDQQFGKGLKKYRA